jgi:hypothetical protein
VHPARLGLILGVLTPSSHVLFVGPQGRVGSAGRMQDVDPPRVVEVGVVCSGGAKVVEDAQESVNHHLDEVGFPLIKEKVGDQCPCAVLVDEGVVDEPVHGGGEVRPSFPGSPVLVLVVAVTKGS